MNKLSLKMSNIGRILLIGEKVSISMMGIQVIVVEEIYKRSKSSSND